MKLSINRLFDFAKSNNFSSILCQFLRPRCISQLELLDLLATKSKDGRGRGYKSERGFVNGIDSIRALYHDTLDFALKIGPENEEETRGNIAMSNSTKKFILNKFEFLDARHSTVIENFADVVKLMQHNGRDEDLISNFLKIQTSVAVLLQHGFLLSSKKFYQQTGCVQSQCDLVSMCEGVIEHATNLADHNVDALHRCPPVNLHLDLSECPSEVNNKTLNIDCIPSSVRFVLLELLKNAISSTLLQHGASGDKNSDPLPPIDIKLESTKTHVIAHVRDRGVGLKGSTLSDLSKFVYNIRRKEVPVVQASYQPQSASLSGMGAGLSVSMIWAHKFGGKLELHENHDIQLNGGDDCSGAVARFSIPRNIDIEESLPLN